MTSRILKTAIVVLALAASLESAVAQSHTPAEGSTERKAILDAARAPVEKELGQRVVFVARTFRVGSGWAFLHARMTAPGSGGDISYAGTSYENAARRGHKSDNYVALLRAAPQGWRVEDYVIGPTDMAWVDWSQKYGAPKDIFPDVGE